MLQKTSASVLRQQWLEEAGDALRAWFLEKNSIYKIPKTIRYSIGWPKGSHGGQRAIGQCWSTESSDDKHSEIFVSPELGHKGKPTVEHSVRILGVLAHEFVHALAGNKAGHRIRAQPKEGAKNYEQKHQAWLMSFPVIAGAIGLEGKWTATVEGAEFEKWAKTVVKKIGPFPAGALNLVNREKQSTRLKKCECPACGYIARVTAKWVDSKGPPVCPEDRVSMSCETDDDDEGDDE